MNNCFSRFTIQRSDSSPVVSLETTGDESVTRCTGEITFRPYLNQIILYLWWRLLFLTILSQQTFHFDASLWSNKETFNLDGGKTGFDSQETKLPSYWNTSFSKICLGMKIGQQIRFIVINKEANSLYSLIADGQCRKTSLRRDTWKSLIGSEASLQLNCNKEGFNAQSNKKLDGKDHSEARIGFLGNNEKNCGNCDSRIGFGTGGLHDNNNTCGNEARYSSDNGKKHIKGIGYILVQ